MAERIRNAEASDDKKIDLTKPYEKKKKRLPLDQPAEFDGSTIVTRARDTVTVACNLPNGLMLQLSHEHMENQPKSPGQYHEVKVFRKEGPAIKVNGTAVPFGSQPAYMIIGRYALTPNVPREFFEEWLRQNADADIVRNELIFAHKSPEDINMHAKDNRDVLSGLQPLDPIKDPRRPTSSIKGLRNIGQADLSDDDMMMK